MSSCPLRTDEVSVAADELKSKLSGLSARYVAELVNRGRQRCQRPQGLT